MKYTELIQGIQKNYPLMPVAVTMGVIEHLKYVERQPDDAIKRMISYRGATFQKALHTFLI